MQIVAVVVMLMKTVWLLFPLFPLFSPSYLFPLLPPFSPLFPPFRFFPQFSPLFPLFPLFSSRFLILLAAGLQNSQTISVKTYKIPANNLGGRCPPRPPLNTLAGHTLSRPPLTWLRQGVRLRSSQGQRDFTGGATCLYSTK